MKLPAFEYASPSSVAEAVALLGSSGGTAKLLSGGQSLLPVMAFRLAAPSLLVDIRRIPGLDRIDIGRDGIVLGAKVRWVDIASSKPLRPVHPLLCAAVDHVAHYQIRNRGTVGGSLAHADPAAEMPGVAVACDAEVTLIGPKGSRVLAAREFFVGALSTAIATDEMIVSVRFPVWPAARRWGFEEFARRRGDFAMAGVAVYYDVDNKGLARNAHIGVIGACLRPHRIPEAEAALDGREVNQATIEATAQAACAAVDPPADLHASAEYRRSLTGTLLERALKQAASRKTI
jgi:carbon-monoxide dehydrogenase medium subunit